MTTYSVWVCLPGGWEQPKAIATGYTREWAERYADRWGCCGWVVRVLPDGSPPPWSVD